MSTTPLNSGADPKTMQVLAITSTQQLLWDFSDTQCFFVLTLGPPQVLQKTSPFNAFSFYGNAGLTNIYNPFIFNAYIGKISNQV